MSIVANEGRDVLVSYNYMLRVEGMYDLPCKSVHSFTKENEFEYVQEGGLNDYVHMLRKPISKPFSFTVERYVGTDPYPVLPMGAELVLPVILMVSPYPREFGKSKRTFVFTGCTVMSKTYGELNAEKSGILTETIVIGYREMMEVTVPVHFGEDGKLWAFDKNGNYLGNKKLSQKESPVTNTVSEKRRWLAKDGEQRQSSAKKRENGTNAAKSALPQRYWIETTLSFGDIQDSEAKKDAEELGTTKQIAPTVPRIKTRSAKNRQKLLKLDAVEGEQRYWIENTLFPEEYVEKKTNRLRIKKQSAKTRFSVTQKRDPDAKAHRYWIKNTLFPENYQAEKLNVVRIQQKSAKTRFSVTQKRDPDAKAHRYWIKNTLFPKDYQEEKINVVRVQKQSAKTRASIIGEVKAEEKATRLWKIDQNNAAGTGKVSHKFRIATEPVQRRWSEGQSSAKKNEGTEVTPITQRRWEFGDNTAEGNSNRSSKSGPNSKAQGRKWKIDNQDSAGTGEQSAVQAPNSKAQGRKWKINNQTPAGTGEQSAVQAPNSKAEGRKWKID
ncbi:MAG: hypothetical protein Q4C06_03470, partial [Bacillota bacterium]|nr:hypothetical protein [Bacillota bacterium]